MFKAPFLVSVALAQGETGILQTELPWLIHQVQQRGGWFHVDAVQALGRCSLDLAQAADLLTLSTHKCGGMKGFGVLVMRKSLPLKPLYHGGGQEFGWRPGTPCPALIVASTQAFLEAQEDLKQAEAWRLRHHAFEQALFSQDPRRMVVGENQARLPQTTCVITPGWPQEAQLIACDLRGICVSAGSACSSGKMTPSASLLALGYRPEDVLSAIRISAGWNTTQADYDALLEVFQALKMPK